MTPRSWDGPFPAARPRRTVQGGVVVAKPGKVTSEAAAELVAAAEMETASTILARGRTYARAGQVVELEVAEGRLSAQIQGTDAEPYRVRLLRTTISGSDRIVADCSCPYGCDFDWCKHAAALAYVGAYLLETQPAIVAAWTGTDRAGGTAMEVAGLTEEELAALRAPAAHHDVARLLAAAEELVPHPWGLTDQSRT